MTNIIKTYKGFNQRKGAAADLAVIIADRLHKATSGYRLGLLDVDAETFRSYAAADDWTQTVDGLEVIAKVGKDDIRKGSLTIWLEIPDRDEYGSLVIHAPAAAARADRRREHEIEKLKI